MNIYGAASRGPSRFPPSLLCNLSHIASAAFEDTHHWPRYPVPVLPRVGRHRGPQLALDVDLHVLQCDVYRV